MLPFSNQIFKSMQSRCWNGITKNSTSNLRFIKKLSSFRAYCSKSSDYNATITPIDCNYMERPAYGYAYLIQQGSECAFIDASTNAAVPLLLQALEQKGLKPKDVKYVIPTHAHLDHAGAVGSLIKMCPNATVLAHPRAARHIVDPSKLIAGARKVYGDATFDALFGEIIPVPAERVKEVGDKDQHNLGDSRPLEFIHTRGHAKHHMVIHDILSKSVFTGDAFGVAYKVSKFMAPPKPIRFLGLNLGSTPKQKTELVFPSSSPVDFEPEEYHKSADTILQLRPERLYFTHGGVVTDIQDAALLLHTGIDALSAIMHELIGKFGEYERRGIPADEDALYTTAETKVREFFNMVSYANGIPKDEPEVIDLMRTDIELNAQGLVIAAAREFKKRKPS